MSSINPVIETIKSILLDFQETPLDTGVPRRLRIETAHGRAAVCIGVWRSGRSTYLFQVIQRLLDGGVPRQNILYLNFFDDRLHNLRQDNLGLIAEAYYSIYPEKKNAETVYCFFDEIQAAPRLGALRGPFDAHGKMRGVSDWFVGQDAVEGDRHADARSGSLVGDVPVLVQGIPGLQGSRERRHAVDEESAPRSEGL